MIGKPASAAAAALVLALSPAAAGAANVEALLYERTLMGEAGARCRLFAPPVAAALDASRRQARGAALRAGSADAMVAEVEARARARAWSVGCGSPDLATAAGRVRAGFEGYVRLFRLSFPGSLASWRADRYPGPRWRLAQTSGPLTFGIAADSGGAESLTAVWTGPEAAGASGARLVMRDPLLARSAYLDLRKPGLAGRAPPAGLTRTIWASAKVAAPAELLADPHRGGTLYRFSAAATAALAELDPREAVTVELVFPTRQGERTRSALVEVGDFAAGRAFLAVR